MSTASASDGTFTSNVIPCPFRIAAISDDIGLLCIYDCKDAEQRTRVAACLQQQYGKALYEVLSIDSANNPDRGVLDEGCVYVLTGNYAYVLWPRDAQYADVLIETLQRDFPDHVYTGRQVVVLPPQRLYRYEC